MAPWNIPSRRDRSQDPAARGPAAVPATRDADPPHAGLAGIANTFMYENLVNPSGSSGSPFVAQARNLHGGGHTDFERDERTGRSTHRREPTHSPRTPRRPVPYSNADALAALDPEGHLGVLPSASSTSSFGDWGRSPRNENGLHPLAPASHRQLWPNASSPSLPISQNPPQLPPLDPPVPFGAYPWDIESGYRLPLRHLTHNSRSVERLVPALDDLAYRPRPPPPTFSLQRPPPPRARSESPAVFQSREQRRRA